MSEADGNMSKKDGNPPKEGEESFNEEIKDYAKTTMNELLGMFGYDDEMTSESVSSLEIKVPTPPDDLKRAGPSTAMTPVLSVPNQTTAASMATVSMAPAPAPVLILSGHGMKSNDTPIIVKVEGSTSASDVVRKQNSEAMAQSPIQIQIPSTISLPAVTVSAPATAVRTQGPAVEPALAPHFYATPPAVRGLFCVVANLPMIDNQGKSAMTFKFWNCITCSEYFLHKPEVVFRVQYPHLFTGQPEWLYQAAVCVKCHQNLKARPPNTTLIPSHQSKATFKVIACGPDKKPINEPVANSVSMVTTSSAAASNVIMHTEVQNGSRPQKSNGESSFNHESGPSEEPLLLGDEPESDSADDASDAKESYKCYVCSKSVKENSRQNKLRRSKFSSLFTELPDNVGHFKVCKVCFERLNHQRERYILANTPDNERDYVAHIKIWTGIDITCKSSSTYTPIVCSVCDRLTEDCKEPNRPIFRSRYPTLFRNLPDNVIHLPICDKCYKKLQKVKLRYDNLQTVEEERDYVQFINMWRAKKGLGRHNIFM